MRSTRLALVLTFLLTLATQFVMAQQWPRKENDGDEMERIEWFYAQRAYPRRSTPPGARVDAIRQLRQIDSAMRAQHQAGRTTGGAVDRSIRSITMDTVNWSPIGPMPSDEKTPFVSAGRVNAIAIDPRDSNVVYIGAAEGGVWKTTDGGANWLPLTDQEASLASGAIVIDPNSPDTVYVGTGEENFSTDTYYGAGILKSTNGGKTWTSIVGPFLRDRIGAIAIQPGNNQVLLCTSLAGVWRSTNGGTTWTNTLSFGEGISVVFDPTNGSSAYASIGTYFGSTKNGVYHSTDGGVTWKAANGSGPAALPGDSAGRIDIALAPSSPSTIYAQLADPTTYGLVGIYKTTDGGANWSKLPIANPSIWGLQLFYDNSIRVHPTNPDIVWSGTIQVFRSLDGGATWTALPQSGTNNVAIHVDFHYFAFTPEWQQVIHRH